MGIVPRVRRVAVGTMQSVRTLLELVVRCALPAAIRFHKIAHPTKIVAQARLAAVGMLAWVSIRMAPVGKFVPWEILCCLQTAQKTKIVPRMRRAAIGTIVQQQQRL